MRRVCGYLSHAWGALRRRLRQSDGLTIIEYGVFAAFVVMLLVGATIVVGPKLKNWVVDTIHCITDKNATEGPNGGACNR